MKDGSQFTVAVVYLTWEATADASFLSAETLDMRYTRRAAAVTERINAVFWDAALRLYRFAKRGVGEWVFGEKVALPGGYISSATLPLAGMRRLQAERTK